VLGASRHRNNSSVTTLLNTNKLPPAEKTVRKQNRVQRKLKIIYPRLLSILKRINQTIKHKALLFSVAAAVIVFIVFHAV
jgi:hypothetical protein